MVTHSNHQTWRFRNSGAAATKISKPVACPIFNVLPQAVRADLAVPDHVANPSGGSWTSAFHEAEPYTPPPSGLPTPPPGETGADVKRRVTTRQGLRENIQNPRRGPYCNIFFFFWEATALPLAKHAEQASAYRTQSCSNPNIGRRCLFVPARNGEHVRSR